MFRAALPRRRLSGPSASLAHLHRSLHSSSAHAGLWSALATLFKPWTMEAVGSPIPPPAATRRLDAADGPLVWIDCEMTGLTTADRLLEVACIITDGDLTPLDQGVSYVIQTPKDVLDNMNAW